MSEHTAGPWRLGNIPDSVVSDTDPREGRGWQPKDDPDGLREQEYYGGWLVAESVVPRDRPIIAAAPDLLAACEQARDLFFNAMEPLDDETRAVYLAVLIAIARAKNPDGPGFRVALAQPQIGPQGLP